MLKKAHLCWDHSIDRKYRLIHVKFEIELFILFARNIVTTKKWLFSIGDGLLSFEAEVEIVQKLRILFYVPQQEETIDT